MEVEKGGFNIFMTMLVSIVELSFMSVHDDCFILTDAFGSVQKSNINFIMLVF